MRIPVCLQLSHTLIFGQRRSFLIRHHSLLSVHNTTAASRIGAEGAPSPRIHPPNGSPPRHPTPPAGLSPAR